MNDSPKPPSVAFQPTAGPEWVKARFNARVRERRKREAAKLELANKRLEAVAVKAEADRVKAEARLAAQREITARKAMGASKPVQPVPAGAQAILDKLAAGLGIEPDKP